MAFDNVVFPYYPMKHDITRTVEDPVNIVTNGTYEYRVKRQRWDKFTWVIPTQTMKADQRDAIKSFLAARNHGLNSFKFQDPDLPSLTDALLAHDHDSKWRLAIPFDENTAGTHPIFHHGTMTATVNGSPASIIGYEVHNGIPLVHVSGSHSGSIVRISGPIYFAVRLANTFSEAYSALNSSNRPIGLNVSEIELQEVFGEY